MDKYGKCKRDGKKCYGKSLICHLHKDEKHPTYRDLGDVQARPFFNYVCSNFVKPEDLEK